MATSEEILNNNLQSLITQLVQNQAKADAAQREQEKSDAEQIKLQKEANEKLEEQNKQEKNRDIERRLLGQSEKQYEATLAQRKVAEDAKKEMDEIASILGDDAKNNKEYQKAQEKYNKEQAKAEKLKGRRNLLSRFKDAPGKAGAAIAGGVKGAKDAGMAGLSKTFEGIGKLVKKFAGIFAIMILPALMLLVNSPIFPMLKDIIRDFITFFDEKIMPVLKKIKDELMPIFKKLYDNVIVPIKDFFVEFMTKEGGGFDTLFNGLKKQFKNFKAIFDDVVNILSSLMKGDFKAVKEHISNLGKNILKSIRDAIDTFLEFFLKMFGLEKKEGEKGGIDMLKNLLGRVVDNLVKTISDLFQTVIDGIMSFTQDMVRALPGGDTIADLVFGKKSVKDMSVEEQQVERKELKGELEERTGEGGEIEKTAKAREEAETKLKALEKEAEEAGGFDNIRKDSIIGQLGQDDIIEAREKLQAAKAEEKEAADKLKADQQRLKQLEESLDPKKQLEKPPPSEAEKATEVNKAANDNKNGPPIAIGGPTNVSTTNPTKTSVAGPVSTAPHPNSATGLLARGGGSMSEGFM